MQSVLVVDDEPNILEVLEVVLRDEGMEVFRASSGHDALCLLQKRTVDVVISDIRMQDLSGVDLLKQGRQLAPETVFIMITAFATTETAIEALQHGAYDYLTKPFRIEEIRKVVRHALEKKTADADEAAVAEPEPELEARQSQKLFQALSRSRIVGKSPKMLDVYRTVGTVSGTESTVLITGESGTGKELVARAIHEASARREGPFVSINCGAFPETLLESELFGYTKGAFTGAAANRKGLFELANGGSIFLDEIAEMSTAMQVKLLRVLQERKVRPLGARDQVAVDVRVIAATNRDLQSAIQQGQFREDLYYRVAVITIPLPALRERPEDIELLATHFLRGHMEKSGKKLSGISAEAMRCLLKYSWPGNVRELENTIERAVALETTELIRAERLPEAVTLNNGPVPYGDSVPLPEGSFDLVEFLADLERNLICKALRNSDGNQTLAAQQLSLTYPSLRHKIQTLGIDPSKFRRN
jgi:two-component system response regulator PilR (NtrC family)